MSLFDALSISGSGVDAMQTWIDTSGGNIANSNDAVPTNQGTYAEQFANFAPTYSGIPGEGAGVAVSVSLGSTTGEIAYEPNNPIADSKGDVRVPNISLGSQLVQLIQAQNGYEADTSAMSKAVAAYQAGLTIGS